VRAEVADKNAFEIMDTPDGPVLRGARQDLSSELPGIEASKIRTWVGVCRGNGDHGNNSVVVQLPGLWEPHIGMKVQLCEANRDAMVCSVDYRFGVGGDLDVYVFLDDPETTQPD
jgi:hypothetical protein